MKNKPVIDYILQTNFGDFIGGGFPYPAKLKFERDPKYAAHWEDVARASHVAEAINNHFIAETSIKRGNDIRVAVVRREVHTSYKFINEFPKKSQKKPIKIL